MKKVTLFVLILQLLGGMLNPIKSKAIEFNKINTTSSINSYYALKNGEELVDIEDEDLKEAIRTQLKKTDQELTKSDLKQVEQLVVDGEKSLNKELKSFKGLEYCVNLNKLTIKNKIIKNLDNMPTNLKNLTELNLCCDNITDIYQIGKLNNLKSLDISGNNISDISQIDELKSLTNLVDLNISNNNISDISSLASLTNLKILNAENEKITLKDIESDININIPNPFKNIDGSNITNIYDISNNGEYDNKSNTLKWRDIPNSRCLEFSLKDNVKYANTTVNFSAKVKQNVNITRLHLDNDELERILINKLRGKPDSFLTKEFLNTITSLDLSNLALKSIEGLEYFNSLVNLNLYHNKISDLKPLSNLTNLKNLNLNSNHITDISPLNKLQNIEYLAIKYQCIDVGDIDGTNEIVFKNPLVNIDRTPIQTISNISNSGQFYKDENVIKWPKVSSDTRLDFFFESSADIGKTKLEFSGQIKNKALYDAINFKNNEIKKVVCNQLNKDENALLTRRDIENIQSLNLSGKLKYDNDLTDIKNFTNLISLNLSNNETHFNLNSIKKLNKLEVLNLNSNRMKNLLPLRMLNNLKKLYINNNTYLGENDYSVMKNLTNLEELDLSNNFLKSFDFLKGLSNLKFLSLHHNYAFDIEPILSLKKLEYLNISSLRENKYIIIPLDELQECTSLRHLICVENWKVILKDDYEELRVNCPNLEIQVSRFND